MSDDPTDESRWSTQVGKNEDRIDNLYSLFERVMTDVSDFDNLDEVCETLEWRVAQLEAEVETLRARVNDQSKAGRVQRIVEAAENKADATMDAVSLTATEIKAATGVSTGHAYVYIDELPEEYPYIRERPEDAQQRGIIVDLETIRTSSE